MRCELTEGSVLPWQDLGGSLVWGLGVIVKRQAWLSHGDLPDRARLREEVDPLVRFLLFFVIDLEHLALGPVLELAGHAEVFVHVDAGATGFTLVGDDQRLGGLGRVVDELVLLLLVLLYMVDTALPQEVRLFFNIVEFLNLLDLVQNHKGAVLFLAAPFHVGFDVVHDLLGVGDLAGAGTHRLFESPLSDGHQMARLALRRRPFNVLFLVR